MRNQQGTPSETELAWLAGFIEGEGSLSLSAWNRFDEHASKYPKISVTIKVYNTDARLIQRCREIIRKLDIEPHLKERDQKPMLKAGGGTYVSRDPMLTLTVSKFSCALTLLEAIRPYLYGDKSTRADLMIEYLRIRIAKFAANGGNFRNVPMAREEIVMLKAFHALTRRSPGTAIAKLEGLLNE